MTFEFTPTADGLRIHDQIENTALLLETPSTPDVAPAETGQFRAPVDDAVSLETTRLGFELLVDILVHHPDGLDEITFGQQESYEQPAVELEIRNPSFKCYVLVETASMTIDATGSTTAVTFAPSTTVAVGVRSFHEHPAGVVSTTLEPESLAAALSTFGSALKTQSPERAYPTLRGHPTELTVGSTTSIPPELETPASGIVIEVPPDISSILTVAPLAYYLAARVEVGSRPMLHTATATHELDPDALAEDVFDVLHHCFSLDCIVRTAGLYDLPLKERRVLESRHTIGVADLYDLPLAARTEAYLEIPRTDTRDLLVWPQVVDLPPTPESIPLLPYLTYSLTAIRSPPEGTRFERPLSAAVDSTETVQTRSYGGTEQVSSSLVETASFPAQHSVWGGPELPLQGSRSALSGFVADTPALDDGRIEVSVVCNDESMAGELNDAYGSAELDRLSVSVFTDCTVDELRALFEGTTHFLHYVGHVDTTGFRCADGTFDARTVHDVGPGGVLLNGCRSADQGYALLNGGTAFGIVTTEDVENEPAIETGRTLARLLDRGFTAADALTFLSEVYPEHPYSIIGNPNERLCPAEDTSSYFRIESNDIRDDAVKATQVVLPSTPDNFGALISARAAPSTPFLQGDHEVIITRNTLETIAETSAGPFVVADAVHWFDDYTADDIWPLIESYRTETA